MTQQPTIYGTCVALPEGAVLLRGGAGSGKSDLALRLMEDGAARLVADDRVINSVCGGFGLRPEDRVCDGDELSGNGEECAFWCLFVSDKPFVEGLEVGVVSHGGERGHEELGSQGA
ncbi:HPr kinase/phosphorylase, partial [Roseospira navarrensis]|uniref:HPr kinase/phosphorylase n=1 Tax=Roseospira navarrensis TaxID=140058 RepID=UPI003CCD17DF